MIERVGLVIAVGIAIMLAVQRLVPRENIPFFTDDTNDARKLTKNDVMCFRDDDAGATVVIKPGKYLLPPKFDQLCGFEPQIIIGSSPREWPTPDDPESR